MPEHQLSVRVGAVMRRILRGIVAVAISIGLLVIAWYAYAAWATWRTSSGRVQSWLERSTPLGASREEVRAFAIDVTGIRPAAGDRCDEYRNRSTSSLTTKVAEYVLLPLPMVTYAYATWCFDDDDRLVGIVVDSGADGP